MGSELRSYDLLTGERIQAIDIGGSVLTRMAREGMILYSMDSTGRLHAIELNRKRVIAKGDSLLYRRKSQNGKIAKGKIAKGDILLTVKVECPL